MGTLEGGARQGFGAKFAPMVVNKTTTGSTTSEISPVLGMKSEEKTERSIEPCSEQFTQ